MIEATLDQHHLQIEKEEEKFLINGDTIRPDIRKLNDRLFHVISAGQSYTVFIRKIDAANRTVQLNINGKTAEIKISSRVERLLKRLGMEAALHKKTENIQAPMPGLIHSIQVSVGDEVQKGDPILVLEAMKMENIIKSPGEGRVAAIHVQEKDSVEKNELLLTFE